MSIIFDFKAIRQAASALGIRTIGEEDRSFPVAIEEPRQLLAAPLSAPWRSQPPPPPVWEPQPASVDALHDRQRRT